MRRQPLFHRELKYSDDSVAPILVDDVFNDFTDESVRVDERAIAWCDVLTNDPEMRGILRVAPKQRYNISWLVVAINGDEILVRLLNQRDAIREA